MDYLMPEKFNTDRLSSLGWEAFRGYSIFVFKTAFELQEDYRRGFDRMRRQSGDYGAVQKQLATEDARRFEAVAWAILSDIDLHSTRIAVLILYKLIEQIESIPVSQEKKDEIFKRLSLACAKAGLASIGAAMIRSTAKKAVVDALSKIITNQILIETGLRNVGKSGLKQAVRKSVSASALFVTLGLSYYNLLEKSSAGSRHLLTINPFVFPILKSQSYDMIYFLISPILDKILIEHRNIMYEQGY